MTDSLQQHIGYIFRDSSLLDLALTHPSVLNSKSNQRLEFLGDSILGAVVAKLLYDLFPEEKEGDLARRHAALVRGETLVQIAREIELGEALNIGTSETQGNGRQKASNLEDALEALIGAMYIDGGMEAVERFVLPRWSELARQTATAPKDAKTSLQEWAQARGLALPAYRTVATSGPAHAPIFTIEVRIDGYAPAQAQAASKRVAEQTAATTLLEALSND